MVHGLNGHPYNTWATATPDVFWPTDLLPQALEEEQVRILTYGYDANVSAFTDGTSKDKIHNHAEHLAAQLAANRGVRLQVLLCSRAERLMPLTDPKGDKTAHHLYLPFPWGPRCKAMLDL